jgi:hypothetical protein
VLLCAAVEVVLLLGAALEGAGGAVPGGLVGDIAGVGRVVGGVVQERRDAEEGLAAGLTSEGSAAEWDVPGQGGEGEGAEVREGGQVVGCEEVLHRIGVCRWVRIRFVELWTRELLFMAILEK